MAHWLTVEQGIEAEASRVEEGGGRYRWVLTWRDGPADLPRLGDKAAEIGLDARRFSVARVITGQALAVTAARIAVRGNCRSTRTRLGWLRPSRPRPAKPTTLADQPAARRNHWPRGCPESRATTPTRAAAALGHLVADGVPCSTRPNPHQPGIWTAWSASRWPWRPGGRYSSRVKALAALAAEVELTRRRATVARQVPLAAAGPGWHLTPTFADTDEGAWQVTAPTASEPGPSAAPGSTPGPAPPPKAITRPDTARSSPFTRHGPGRP